MEHINCRGLVFEKISYAKSGDSIRITGRVSPRDTILIIPPLIDNLPVTEISKYAFENCENLTEIKLPETLKVIERGAFFNCESLKVINFPDSLISIEWKAFYRCRSLTNVKISSSVEIDPTAFDRGLNIERK